MGAYENWVNEISNLSDEQRKEAERQIKEMCRTMTISAGASQLAGRGFLYEDESPTSPFRSKLDGLFDEGEYYVYVWKHLNGDPFYVGSGKGRRSTNISNNRPDRFYAELLAFDAILCYIAFDVSEKEARFIEHYCSFLLTTRGIKLTNGDWNAFRMSEKVKLRWQRYFEKEKAKTEAIDRRIEAVMQKTNRVPEYYDEIVDRVWREYGTLCHLNMNGNLWRAVGALTESEIDAAHRSQDGDVSFELECKMREMGA